MLKSERFVYILGAIREKGVVTVREIMDACGVSDMTARRDLAELEHQGRLARVHGGAQGLGFSLDNELSHQQKTAQDQMQKQAIARHAASLVKDQDVVFLGPGTTVEELARLLRGRDMLVVTTSHPAFMALSGDTTTQVFLVGGEYRAKTESFVGELTLEQVRSFSYTSAFISCNGIHGADITSYSPSEGVIQKTALDTSQYHYLLADHTKFNHKDFYTYCSLEDIDLCITDDGIAEEDLALARTFVDVKVVEAEGTEADA